MWRERAPGQGATGAARASRALLTVAAAVAAVGAVPVSARAALAADAAAPLPSTPFGLVGMGYAGVPGATVAQRTAAYRQLAAAGVRAIRLDIPWATVQPPGGGGRFDFSATDQEVEAIAAAGMKAIAILDYGNPDYSTSGRLAAITPASGGLPPFYIGRAEYFPPDNPQDFARYARAVAQRYSGDVAAWEVWNEENEGWRFWPPHEDPAAYAQLLCATYAAVKPVAPAIPVLFGGVFFPAAAGAPGMSGPDFVTAAYSDHPGLGQCFDAMAYHPYPYPFTAPELDVQVRGSVLSAADQMRGAMAAAGDAGKPLWITEVGWPTSGGYGVSELKQAQYVARMQAATFAQGVTALSWYTYGDFSDPTAPLNGDQEAHFGFFHLDGSPKPAFSALTAFAQVFAGTRFAADLSARLGLPPGQIDTGGRAFALRFTRPGANVTALWLADESLADAQGPEPAGGTASPSSMTVRLPVSSRTVTVTDYLGASRRLAAHAGHVTIVIGPGPLYVTDPTSAGGSARRARRRAARR